MDSITRSIQSKGPLISVIVPVFQVEKYLEKCISSILNQTYHNLEIIIVDDGSTDNCPIICDKFQAVDTRIKVIHRRNGGLSQARNDGLMLAKGDFISFVDSDDWIESNMYEVLMSALIESCADIAVCNYQNDYETKNNIQCNMESYEKKEYTSEEALKLIINSDGYIKSFVWNKLYRKSILPETNFPKGKIYEDTLWTTKTIGNAKLIVCINCHLYHYQYRIDSLSHNNQQIARRIQDMMEMNIQRIEYIHKFYPILKKIAIVQFQNLCCMEYLGICINNSQFDPERKIRTRLYRHFVGFGIKNLLYFDKLGMTVCRFSFWISPTLLEKVYLIYKTIFNKLQIVI